MQKLKSVTQSLQEAIESQYKQARKACWQRWLVEDCMAQVQKNYQYDKNRLLQLKAYLAQQERDLTMKP